MEETRGRSRAAVAQLMYRTARAGEEDDDVEAPPEEEEGAAAAVDDSLFMTAKTGLGMTTTMGVVPEAGEEEGEARAGGSLPARPTGDVLAGPQNAFFESDSTRRGYIRYDTFSFVVSSCNLDIRWAYRHCASSTRSAGVKENDGLTNQWLFVRQ